MAKAIAILDADNRLTFATRIAGAILERSHGGRDPSTALRDPATMLRVLRIHMLSSLTLLGILWIITAI